MGRLKKSVNGGHRGKTAVTPYRPDFRSEKTIKREEIKKVIVAINYYNTHDMVESLDTYLKRELFLTYDAICEDIQLLLLSGVLELDINDKGIRKYYFAEEAKEEVEQICAHSLKSKKNKYER